MAGLIERMAKTPAVLKQPTGTVLDGKVQYTTVNCVVFGLENAAQGFDEYGRVHYGQVFLVAPLASTPVLPGTITVGGKEYTMAEVMPYRNMKGVLYGYRIAVAGGGGGA